MTRKLVAFFVLPWALSCGSSDPSPGDEGGDGAIDVTTGDGDPGTDGGGVDVGPRPDVGGGSDTNPTVDSGPIVAPQPLSPFIVVDQFGYLAVSEKIAVVRSPEKGFDATTKFTPGAKYALVDAHSGAKLLEAATKPWNGGAVDASSGDKAWWFDFSRVTTPGDYFVLDEDQSVRSDVFRIGDDVYRGVLAASVRMYFYQRDGFAKEAKYAGASWTDGAAHMGAGQDPECTLYTDGSGKKDLHGGWWDAGDQNKYTNWAADDALILMHAYAESPGIFFDDYAIPESGNGVADVLDETKWELDWLVRMQNADGSVLSIVGQTDASASKDSSPSKATGPCKYGPANTSATLTTAATFAYAAVVYKGAAAYPGFSDDLATRAKNAWTWAEAHPSVTFSNGGKIGAGEQETDDKGRAQKKLQAAIYLFALTGEAKYQTYVDANYKGAQLAASGYVDCFAVEEQDALLDYAMAKGATAAVAADIKSKYKSGVASGNNLGAVTGNKDPYGAFLYVYTWGSNQVKADQGNLLADVATYGIDDATKADALRGAARFVHYIHGVNPLQMVYLTTMNDLGASKSATRMYHSWFGAGTDWDAFGVSKYGPPPGYLPGGPNPSYAWDGCCPGGCSGKSCGSAPPSPPTGQPAQKSYKDFNDSWPLDSWSVTEPSDGYQARWVRLLSKFVK